MVKQPQKIFLFVSYWGLACEGSIILRMAASALLDIKDLKLRERSDFRPAL